MAFVRKVVQAKAYFLTPEEGGRRHDVDLRNPRYPYEMLADFGLARTEAGHKVLRGAGDAERRPRLHQARRGAVGASRAVLSR